MTATHVAFLRGINVGKAKRIAMADLRAVVEGLGYGDVRTLLNSGNVVFSAPSRGATGHAARIEQAIAQQLGVSSRVTVLTRRELATVMEENPLLDEATDPTRLLVAVLAQASYRERLTPLLAGDWTPDALAVGSRAAYLWLPHGMMDSSLFKALDRALGDAQTTRNWATLRKLQALVEG